MLITSLHRTFKTREIIPDFLVVDVHSDQSVIGAIAACLLIKKVTLPLAGGSENSAATLRGVSL